MGVPRLLPEGGTVVCIGTGPSLTTADVRVALSADVVIAINDAYRLAPLADVIYACDPKWWSWHPDAARASGLKFGVQRPTTYPIPFPASVVPLRNGGDRGLEFTDRGAVRVGIRGGSNSGYQAINVAVHLGATRILLLGYDMKTPEEGPSHWFGEHPEGKPRNDWSLQMRAFDDIPEALRGTGISVVNCSRATALRQFPCQPIDQALAVAA